MTGFVDGGDVSLDPGLVEVLDGLLAGPEGLPGLVLAPDGWEAVGVLLEQLSAAWDADDVDQVEAFTEELENRVHRAGNAQRGVQNVPLVPSGTRPPRRIEERIVALSQRIRRARAS